MKYLTLFYEGNKIEVHNNILGKETIFYNDQMVSKKFSLLGAKHLFEVTEDGQVVNYEVAIKYNEYGLGFCVYRNNQPILLQ